MTIGITTPTPNAGPPLLHTGVGMGISGTISGPTLLDDSIYLQLAGGISGNIVARGHSLLGGSTSWQVFMTDPIAPTAGSAYGDLLSLSAEAHHANGTLFDSNSWGGSYSNDPHSGIASMFGGMNSLLNQNTTLDRLLVQTNQTFKFPIIGALQAIDYVPNIVGGTVVDMGDGPTPLVAVWGISWETITPAVYVGGQVGVITDASRRVVQFAVDHTLLGGGAFTDQVYESHLLTGTFFFDSPNPSNVSVYVYPGYTVKVAFLLT
jgi:hypothetical protein